MTEIETTTTTHPEWSKEHSLTAPDDRVRSANWRPEQGAPPLNEQEVNEAIEALNNTGFTDKFPRVDRTYADPPLPMQNLGLISFTPAKGAKANDSGVYGFAKLRGNFSTEVEANQRAEYLIRNADSYHQIYHAYVGRPFPLTVSSDYSATTEEIDIRKDTTESISHDVREKKNKDERTIQEIKTREEELKADVVRDPNDDPYENYITLSVKKAQLSWTYLEHHKKIKEIREIIISTRVTLAELDEENPDFKEKYFKKYMDARKVAGLDTVAPKEGQDNFIKFMVEEVPLPGIDLPAQSDPPVQSDPPAQSDPETVSDNIEEVN